MSSITTDSIWSTSGSRRMYASATQTTNGSSANTSTIKWTITTTGDNDTYYDTGPTYLWIGGVERYYKARTSWSSLAFPAKAGSKSGSYTLTHNNDGSVANQEIKLKSAIYTGEWNSSTVSKTWTLDKIARYFSSTPTISLASRTETSITLNWSTSETCSAITWHGYKSGAKVTTTGLPGTSGTVTFGDSSTASEKLDANTNYSIYGTFTRSDSSMASDSSPGTYTTHNYPYITAVETANLAIGGTQKLTLSNPMSRSVVIEMRKSDGTLLYTSGATTGTSISITPTASTLYDSIKTAQSANCYYSVICSSPSSTKNTSSTYTYKVTGNETPTFAASSIATYDATTAVTNVTGQTANGGWLVQGLSKLRIAITSAASPKNSASISKYEVTFAGVTKTLGVNSTGEQWAEFNGTGAQTISVKVTDSRGLSTTVTKNVTYIAYRAPSISLSGGRKNNYGEDVDLSVSYTGSDVEGKNGVKVVWEGANKSGYFTGSASDYDTAETNNKSVSISGIKNDLTFTFTATITDKFGKTATSRISVPIGQPTMFVDVEQAGVGVNCLPQGQGLYVADNLRVGYQEGKQALQRYNIDLTGLSSDTFYPITFDIGRDMLECEIYSRGESGGDPWNQNSLSFTLKCQGWSDTPYYLHIKDYNYYDANEITIGSIGTGDQGGANCVWLRGGILYYFYSNRKATKRETGFTFGNEVFSIGPNYYGGSNSNVTIRFTPKSTINGGTTYFSHGIKTSGGISASGKIQTSSSIEATGGSVSASDSLFANNGYLYSICNGKQTKIGCENSSHTHYVTNANTSHWFNKTVQVAGQIMKGSSYNLNVPAVFIQSGQPSASQTGDIWFIT